MEVQNHFNALQAQIEEENDADMMFNNIRRLQRSTFPGRKRKNTVYNGRNNAIIAKQQAVKEAQQVMAVKKTESSIIHLNKAKEDFGNAYNAAENQLS